MRLRRASTELRSVHSIASRCQYRLRSWRCQYDHNLVVHYVQERDVEDLEKTPVPRRPLGPVLPKPGRPVRPGSWRPAPRGPLGPVLPQSGRQDPKRKIQETVLISQLLVLRFQLRHCSSGSASFAALQTSLLWRIVPDPLLQRFLLD